MMGACFLTYDIISSGIKTSAFSQDGKLLAHAYRPLVQHFSGNTAQEPVESWLQGLEETTREVAGQTSFKTWAPIAFTAMSQVCLCIDRDGNPLHEAFTWSDSRSEEVGDPISQRLSQDQVYRLTGLKNTPNSSIRKLFWIKERWPEIYEKTCKMIQCKDYLAYVSPARSTPTLPTHRAPARWTSPPWTGQRRSSPAWGSTGTSFPPLPTPTSHRPCHRPGGLLLRPACGVPVVMGGGRYPLLRRGRRVHRRRRRLYEPGILLLGCLVHGQAHFSTGASLNPHAIPGKFLGFVNIPDCRRGVQVAQE